MEFNKKYKLDLQSGKDFYVAENHWLPNKMGVDFFVFRKTMYCRKKMEIIPKHEFLHVAQYRKYGTFLVITHYLFYLIVNLIKYRNFGKAFKEVPFEVEARRFEEDQH